MILWFFILVVQSAAFTWVSRARNSGSIPYHAAASTVSNSVYFISQLFLIGYVAKPGMPMSELCILGGTYTAGSVVGGTAMHFISIHWLEKGLRKVGS